jgi:hypothetical protein
MVQYLQPTADRLVGAYRTNTGAATNLYQSLADPVPDDTNYVTSEISPAGSVYVVGLGAVTDPVSSTGHTFKWRWCNPEVGGQLDAVVELRQDYSNEGSQGTLRKSWSYTDIPSTFTTVTETLSGAETDSITNYSSLSLRFVMTEV